MSECRDFETLLPLFAGNELGPEPRATTAAHLAACAVCRRKVEDYREIKNRLTALPPPELPETLFADFHAGVAQKIASLEEPRQRLGLVALLYALHRRRRLAIAVATLVFMLALPTWLTHERRFRPTPTVSLIPLLEKRDWTGLYYAMLDGGSRTRLLNEPVPVHLLHAALNELMSVQPENPRLRAGLRQVLSKIKTPAGNSFCLSGSAQILGKIGATGFEPARRSTAIVWNPESALLVATRVGAAQTLTVRELFLQTNSERNEK